MQPNNGQTLLDLAARIKSVTLHLAAPLLPLEGPIQELNAVCEQLCGIAASLAPAPMPAPAAPEPAPLPEPEVEAAPEEEKHEPEAKKHEPVTRRSRS